MEKFEFDFASNNSNAIEIVSEFKKNGLVVLRNFFDKDLIEKLKEDFYEEYNRYFIDKEYSDAVRVSNKRFHLTIEVKDSFFNMDLLCNQFLLNFFTDVFGVHFLISDINCVIALPGASDMHVHRDGLIFYENPISLMLPPHAIGLHIPLVNFTKEIGPTRYWPGSHRKQVKNEEANTLPYFESELFLGDAVLMDYRLMHSGNGNKTNIVRPLLYINYALNWYLDPNNFKKQQYFIMSDQYYEKVPPKLKKYFIRRNLILKENI